MPRAASQLPLLVLAALWLSGCGQKGPLCLQEPKPAAVPVTAPASDSSAPAAAATSPSAPAVASTTAPNHPLVPGYTRCR
jgi:predicted small lipoprotein YifL